MELANRNLGMLFQHGKRGTFRFSSSWMDSVSLSLVSVNGRVSGDIHCKQFVAKELLIISTAPFGSSRACMKLGAQLRILASMPRYQMLDIIITDIRACVHAFSKSMRPICVHQIGP